MSVSRRELLLGLLGSGAAVGLARLQLFSGRAGSSEEEATLSPFEPEVRKALAAAAERVLPGAIAAGVPEYLDYWMVREPWAGFLKGGFATGALWLDRLAKKEHGKLFSALEASDQDALLGRFQRGELTVPRFTGRGFFEALVQFTLEGFLADPTYGGNRDQAGWKLLGQEACHWAPGVKR